MYSNVSSEVLLPNFFLSDEDYELAAEGCQLQITTINEIGLDHISEKPIKISEDQIKRKREEEEVIEQPSPKKNQRIDLTSNNDEKAVGDEKASSSDKPILSITIGKGIGRNKVHYRINISKEIYSALIASWQGGETQDKMRDLLSEKLDIDFSVNNAKIIINAITSRYLSIESKETKQKPPKKRGQLSVVKWTQEMDDYLLKKVDNLSVLQPKMHYYYFTLPQKIQKKFNVDKSPLACQVHYSILKRKERLG